MNTMFIILFISILIIILAVSFSRLTNNTEDRCNKLKTYDLNSYIKNYKTKRKSTNDKVVVSFTTTPDRIEKIKPMLNSILDQTVKIDQISMNIPEESKNKKYNVPTEYKNVCNVYKSGKDYGPGTKYIPTLLRESECGTKIIIVDDDQLYGDDLIEKLLEESEKNPDKCIYAGDKFSGSGGILIKPEFMSDVNHDICDDKWLEDNLLVDKINIKYNKNKKYI